MTNTSSEQPKTRMVAVDGTDALAYVIVRPGAQPGSLSMEAGANGLGKPAAAEVLRHVADQWGGLPEHQTTRNVLAEVASERRRQDDKFGEQNHRDGADGANSLVCGQLAEVMRDANEDRESRSWTAILLEEAYEAGAETDPARIRAELVQVAAVAVAWIEAIDRRADPSGQDGR